MKKDKILGMIFAVVAAIAIGNIISIEKSCRAATGEYNRLYDTMPFSDKRFDVNTMRRSLGEHAGKSRTPAAGARPDPEEIASRLRQISDIYADVVGWIDFDTLPISYPLMQGETNQDYLRTTYSGTKATAGSVFVESMNSADLEDRHTIIYGHNMKDGSMFGRLKKYVSPDFMEKNRYFTIYTPGGDAYLYEAVSCMVVPLDSYVYNLSFEDEEAYGNFLHMIGYDGDDIPQSVTLSTCAGIDKAYRLVVNAVRKQEGFSEEGLLTYFSK